MLGLILNGGATLLAQETLPYFEQIIADFNELGGWQVLISMLLRVILACVLGSVFGFEREIKNKPAGYVTFLLVSLGSCLFAILQCGMKVLGPETQDVSRIIAQVVSGVGFLGAGTILHNRGSVKGITTAALLWVSASIGLLVGTGGIINITIAIFSTVIVYPLTLVTRRLGKNIVNKRQVHRLFIVFEEEKEKDLYEILSVNGAVVTKTFFHNKNMIDNKNFKEVYIYLKASKKYPYDDLLDHLSSYEWVKAIENA